MYIKIAQHSLSKNTSKYLAPGEILFFTGIFLWTVQEYIFYSGYSDLFGGMIDTGIRYLCMLLFLLKIVLSEEKFTERFLVIIALPILLILFAEYNADAGIQYFQVILLIFAAKDVPFRKITKIVFFSSVLSMGLIFLGDVGGIIYHSPDVSGERIRYYLGFNYYSTAPIYAMNIVFCGLYAYTDIDNETECFGRKLHYRREVSWVVLAAAELFVFWLYRETDTVLPFVAASGMIFLYIVVIKLRINIYYNCMLTKAVSVMIFPTLALLTFICSYCYNPDDDFWYSINSMIHNRLYLGQQGIQQYGISLFGQKVNERNETALSSYFYIDSGYMKVLLTLGLFVFLFIIAAYCEMYLEAVRNQDLVLCIWLLIVAGYNIFNNILFSPGTNTAVLAIWYIAELVRHRRWKKKSYLLKAKKSCSSEKRRHPNEYRTDLCRRKRHPDGGKSAEAVLENKRKGNSFSYS